MAHPQNQSSRITHQDRGNHLWPYLREVIHTINSPIGVILGTAQFAVAGVDGKKPEEVTEQDLLEVIESLRIIERQSKRCAGLIQGIRELSRASQINRKPTDLNACVRQALKDFDWSGQGIVLIEDLSDDLPSIEADGDRLVAAFIAIARNSYEAMPDGGEFRAATRVAETAIEAIFDDTGPGIEDADLDKVFRPSFSRKDRDSGFGLAIVQLILEAHGAEITIESEPGKGTRVVVSGGW